MRDSSSDSNAFTFNLNIRALRKKTKPHDLSIARFYCSYSRAIFCYLLAR